MSRRSSHPPSLPEADAQCGACRLEPEIPAAASHRNVPTLLTMPGLAQPSPALEQVVVESELEIRVDGREVVRLWRTPGRDPALARGHCFVLGILPRLALPCAVDEGLGEPARVDLRIGPEQRREAVVDLQRRIAACEPLTGHGRLALATLPELFRRAAETIDPCLLANTCPWAALVAESGGILAVGEDLDPLLAIDKALGGLDALHRPICLLLSAGVGGGAIARAIAAGIPFVCSTGHPSSLAMRLASDFGLSLLGACQQGRATIYTHPDAVLCDPLMPSRRGPVVVG